MDVEVMLFFPLEKSGEDFACGTSYLPHSIPAPWIVSHTYYEKGFQRSLSTGILTRMSKMASIYPLDYAMSQFIEHPSPVARTDNLWVFRNFGHWKISY